MSQIKLVLLAVISTCLLYACSGNNSAASKQDSASNNATTNSGDSTYTGDNSFAYTINGRETVIKDFMHDGDGKNWMALYLNEVKNDPATAMVKLKVTNEFSDEVFNFSFANSGSTTILHYSPSLSDFANKKSNEADYMSAKLKNYYGDSVIINITSINPTRVAGTFSGKFLSHDDKPVAMEITDGRFDVAFTKDKVTQ